MSNELTIPPKGDLSVEEFIELLKRQLPANRTESFQRVATYSKRFGQPINPEHVEFAWFRELREVRPNKNRRDPFIDPNFIDPNDCRLDPYDPDKGGYG